ncbi:MAG: ABC transporter ATP-binding protein, partial [Opitutae bacterium]|nr:ABC transporter ATP-binding protein [Opitutae bacterium]
AMSEQGGLVAGLKNASPEPSKKAEKKTKIINAKERRRVGAEKRKIESANRKEIRKRVTKLESEILALEEDQSEITKLLEDPDSYSDPDKAKELNVKAARIAKKLSEKNYEWDIETENLLKLEADS